MSGSIKIVHDFLKLKNENKKISIVTCYDFSFARIAAQSPVDALLIGDSCGNVIAGYGGTIPVTVDEMVYHTKAVRRGAPDSFIVADMPFMSYQVSREEALRNAGRLLKEGGAQSVKIEGGEAFAETVRALVQSSIPVMGHLGLTPQSEHALGGYRVQGRNADAADKILYDAKVLEQAGAFAIVLEMIPETLGKTISEKLTIPTIGIGAGRYTDGQVLVLYDLLGLDPSFNPKFLKKYESFGERTADALKRYAEEVERGTFPGEGNVF